MQPDVAPNRAKARASEPRPPPTVRRYGTVVVVVVVVLRKGETSTVSVPAS